MPVIGQLSDRCIQDEAERPFHGVATADGYSGKAWAHCARVNRLVFRPPGVNLTNSGLQAP